MPSQPCTGKGKRRRQRKKPKTRGGNRCEGDADAELHHAPDLTSEANFPEQRKLDDRGKEPLFRANGQSGLLFSLDLKETAAL